MGLLKHILLGNFGQSLDISETAERVELQEKAQQLQSSRLRSKDLEIFPYGQPDFLSKKPCHPRTFQPKSIP